MRRSSDAYSTMPIPAVLTTAPLHLLFSFLGPYFLTCQPRSLISATLLSLPRPWQSAPLFEKPPKLRDNWCLKQQKHFLVVIKIDQLPGAGHICTGRSGSTWPWVRFQHPVSSHWGDRHTPTPFHDCRAMAAELKALEMRHTCTHHIYFFLFFGICFPP